MPNTVFFIEIVGFFSRTIGFADSLYAAVGMFHGKQMPQTGHGTKGVPERNVSRETYVSQGTFSLCTAALFDCKKKRRIKRRLRRVKLKQKLFSYYSVCIDGDTVR